MSQKAIGPTGDKALSAFRLQANLGREERIDDHRPRLQGVCACDERKTAQSHVNRNGVEPAEPSSV